MSRSHREQTEKLLMASIKTVRGGQTVENVISPSVNPLQTKNMADLHNLKRF